MAAQPAPHPSLLARLTPSSPLPLWQGQAIAVAAVAAAAMLRWSLQPVLGDDVSFATLFPAVIVTTMLAAAPGAFTVVVAGAIACLAPSAAGGVTAAMVRHATPRLIVWVLIGTLVAAMALALRSTIVALRRRQAELVEAHDHLQTLTRELEHRGRNALTVVQGLSSMTARTVDTVDEYRRQLSRRIQALSSASSLLLGQPSASCPLARLVHEVLDGFGAQISIEGPDVLAPTRSGVAFALALHELATNAVKYGALSRPEGIVTVSWTVDGARVLHFKWREAGGPPIAGDKSEGVGSGIIRQAFSGLAGARPELTMAPQGVCFVVHLPLAHGRNSGQRSSNGSSPRLPDPEAIVGGTAAHRVEQA
ncbi:MAG TPA: sensor histidine kinase [Caulobacteraceae bacterium]|nr:sensor histidine kinase [Caulobacteraceae bacterium]